MQEINYEDTVKMKEDFDRPGVLNDLLGINIGDNDIVRCRRTKGAR